MPATWGKTESHELFWIHSCINDITLNLYLQNWDYFKLIPAAWGLYCTHLSNHIGIILNLHCNMVTIINPLIQHSYAEQSHNKMRIMRNLSLKHEDHAELIPDPGSHHSATLPSLCLTFNLSHPGKNNNWPLMSRQTAVLNDSFVCYQDLSDYDGLENIKQEFHGDPALKKHYKT